MKQNKQFTLWINKYLLFDTTIKNRIKAWCKKNRYPAYVFANQAVIDHAGLSIMVTKFDDKYYREISSQLTSNGISIGEYISSAVLNKARLESIITDEEYNLEMKNVKRK